ncbi:MAG TPA: hypothetical protein PK141_08465 [Polyangiaceae bacterium]|nr:hypothetical protein [Polyangiaceae bacterium]
MRAALVPVAAIGAALTVGAFALSNARTGASVLVGAAIATSNLYVLIRVVEALLTPADEPVEGPAGTTAKDRAAASAIAEPAEPVEPVEPAPAAPKSTFSAAWALLGVLKMLVLFGGIWALMTRALVDPIGLVVGYGCLPLGVSLRGLAPALRPRRSTRRDRGKS